MSKYSEIIGSFNRMGDFPIEANYIFASEQELKSFYSDPINYATIHLGLLKIVQSDDEGNQALYWVTKDDNGLHFTKLVSGSLVNTLYPQVQQLVTKLEEEIKERQFGEQAIWGTINPTTISENLNSIYDISEAIIKLTEKVEQGSIGALKGLVDKAYYDSTYESLVIVFNLEDGSTQKLSIPMTNMIREWEPNNEFPHKVVELTREEVYAGGADRLSADVRLSTRTDNIIEKDGNSLLVRGVTSNIDHNGTTLDVIVKRLQKRIAALEKLIEEGDVGTVVPINIVSFISDCNSVNELGTIINPTFSWTYNINNVDSQTLNNIAVDLVARSSQIKGIDQDTTVTLFASYKGYSDSREIEFTFVPRIYFGGHPSEQLSGVTELPSSELNYSVANANFDCYGGKYAYIAVPSQFKSRTKFYINGSLEVTAYTTSTIGVTNSTGNTMEYTLFKLDNFYHGQFNMDIKII